jgi:hypothetical protein
MLPTGARLDCDEDSRFGGGAASSFPAPPVSPLPSFGIVESRAGKIEEVATVAIRLAVRSGKRLPADPKGNQMNHRTVAGYAS